MNRKKFLKSEIKKVEKTLKSLPWQLEIVKIGKKDVREGIRQEYDRLKEIVNATEVKLEEEEKKEKKNDDMIKNLKSTRDKLQPDLLKMEEQMKELDKELGEVDKTLQVKVEAGRSYIGLVKKLLKQ